VAICQQAVNPTFRLQMLYVLPIVVTPEENSEYFEFRLSKSRNTFADDCDGSK
jgi:hypothetical protein